MLTVRNCIVIEQAYDAASLPAGVVTMKVADSLWRQILVGEKRLALALAQGGVEIEGGSVEQLSALLGIFES